MASQAYRMMLRTGFHTERTCGIGEGGLVQHVRRRWREQALANMEAGYTQSADGARQHPELRGQLERVDSYCNAMLLGEEVSAIRGMLGSLALGVGSPAYVARVEHGIMQYVSYDKERRSRSEGDDQVGEQRQNRVLVQALLPAAKKLAVVHQHRASQQDLLNELGSMSQKTSSGSKDGGEGKVTHHVIGHGENETMVVEVDTEVNKQTIFLTCEPYNFERDGDTDVEILEPQNARGVWCHAGWYRVAQRYAQSILEETPVHKSRGTTVVAHGAAGAVAVGLATILQLKGFDIRNVVTFGGCKYATRMYDRIQLNLNILRVVMAKDPLPLLPTTSSDFSQFVHYGEKFSLHTTRTSNSDDHSNADERSGGGRRGLAEMLQDDLARNAEAEEAAEKSGQNKPYDDGGCEDSQSPSGFKTFSMPHYIEMMQSDKLKIEYQEEDVDVVEDNQLPVNPANLVAHDPATGMRVAMTSREPRQHPSPSNY